jgi:hypothetical protein
MSPRATGQAMSFSSFPVAVCLVFRTCLTDIMTSIIAEFLSNYEGIVANQGFDFHINIMQPGELDIIMECENGFEGLRFWKVFAYLVINKRMG